MLAENKGCGVCMVRSVNGVGVILALAWCSSTDIEICNFPGSNCKLNYGERSKHRRYNRFCETALYTDRHFSELVHEAEGRAGG